MAEALRLHDPACDDVAVWGCVAAEIEAIAERVAERSRNRRLGPTVRALGLHTAGELASCAAELRANIALLEAYHG